MSVSDGRVQEKFSSRLKQLRESRGMTRMALADELEVSRASIGYYEARERVPDIVFLNRAAEFFGVSADYLLGLTDTTSPEPSVQDAVALTGLTEGAIKTLEDINSLGFQAKGALEIVSELLDTLHYGLISRSIMRAAFATSERSIPANVRTDPTDDGRITLSPQDTIGYLDMQVRYIFNRDIDDAITKFFSVYYDSLKEGGKDDAEKSSARKRDNPQKDSNPQG